MRVGVPKEVKIHEYRVGLVPAGVRELVYRGHQVMVQSCAGLDIGFDDVAYQNAGARIAKNPSDIFEWADLVIKVKEPQASEIKLIKKEQMLFTYLHLAANEKLTRGLISAGCTAIAYETITDDRGGLPLLAPMSEVAGRMSIQVGAHCLEREQGGAGILLGGVPGVSVAKVVIIGGGVVGTNAARMAMGLEASVTVIDKSLPRLYELDMQYGSTLNTIYSTLESVEQYVTHADLVIGAVLVPGAASPKIINRELIKNMKAGSVVVDVAIDQGGCFETSRPTTHAKPTFTVDGVVHYCVTNMPGAVARTSTYALSNATLPYILALADKGYLAAMKDDPHLRSGLNIHKGEVVHKAVADTLGYKAQDPKQVLK